MPSDLKREHPELQEHEISSFSIFTYQYSEFQAVPVGGNVSIPAPYPQICPAASLLCQAIAVVVQRQHSFIFSYVFLSTISGKQYDSCGRSREGSCKQNTLLTAKKRRWNKFSFLFF
jgi:hypothetical protein